MSETNGINVSSVSVNLSILFSSKSSNPSSKFVLIQNITARAPSFKFPIDFSSFSGTFVGLLRAVEDEDACDLESPKENMKLMRFSKISEVKEKIMLIILIKRKSSYQKSLKLLELKFQVYPPNH